MNIRKVITNIGVTIILNGEILIGNHKLMKNDMLLNQLLNMNFQKNLLKKQQEKYGI